MAVDQNNLPAHLRFRALFFPPDTLDQRKVDENEGLRIDRQKYLDEIESPTADPQKAREALYVLATKYANNPEYEVYGFRPDDIRESFVRDQLLPTERPFEGSEAPELTAARGAPKKNDDKSSTPGSSSADLYEKQAKEALKESQKKAVLDAFDELVKNTKPDDLPAAIEKFYHDHLSAAGVVGKQYETLLRQTKQLYGTKDEYQKHADALKDEGDELTRKLRGVHTYGPLGSEEEQDLRDALRPGELQHIQRLKTSSRDSLREEIGSMFDEQWGLHEQRNVLDRFVGEFRGTFGYSYHESLTTGYDEFTSGFSQTSYSPNNDDTAGIPLGGALQTKRESKRETLQKMSPKTLRRTRSQKVEKLRLQQAKKLQQMS